MEDKILAAEIWLHKVDTSEATADIDAELNKIETALKSYNCTASMFDYSIAVISGIFSPGYKYIVISNVTVQSSCSDIPFPFSAAVLDVFRNLRPPAEK